MAYINPASQPYTVGSTVLFSDGISYMVAMVTYVGPDFLMVTYNKKGKSITIRIHKAQVQTQV